MTDKKATSKAINLSLNHVERSRWRRGLAASKISSSAFRLAAVIEDLMNKTTGECFAGQSELAALAGISPRQVREHLEALKVDGWIAILSGKLRTRPRSKRGLHYRPTWPNEATRTRCMDRDYASDIAELRTSKSGGKSPLLADGNTGGKSPVPNEIKTGNSASLNRRSGVSKAAESRRSHSNDQRNDQGGAAQAAPSNTKENSSIRGAGLANAAHPHAAGDEYHEYTCEDYEEIDRRNRSFLAGPLPTCDGENNSADASKDRREFSEGDATADHGGSDEQSVWRMLNVCIERDDDLSDPDSDFVSWLKDRDVCDFSPDELRRLESIVAELPKETDVDFFDEVADNEVHQGVPF